MTTVADDSADRSGFDGTFWLCVAPWYPLDDPRYESACWPAQPRHAGQHACGRHRIVHDPATGRDTCVVVDATSEESRAVPQ